MATRKVPPRVRPPAPVKPAAAPTPDLEQLRGAQAARRAAKRGRSAQRQAFLTQRAGAVDAQSLQDALQVRRQQAASTPKPQAGARAVPVPGDPFLWLPIGPTTVLQGQAGGRPRVSGRVRDMQVSDDGRRAYAGTANGGVWYTDDSGDSWRPLGGWATLGTPTPVDRPSGLLACGCLLVRFGAAADGSADEVLVGTGELLPRVVGRPFSRSSGVGVLRATGPATSNIYTSPWALEGGNLRGLGLFRLSSDPAAPTTLVAATSGGLWTRSGAPAATWTQVGAAPFAGAAGQALICTDVAWVAASGANPARLWVAVRDDAGASSGLWVSTTGLAGPFVQIALPGLQASSRLSLSAAPSDATVMYALGNGNRVWRLDNQVPVAVERIPPNLLGGQDGYNQTLTVHPTRPERIVLGGATEAADGQWSASLYLANVTQPAAGRWRYGFTTTAAGADPTTDDAFIGHGVHADVHAARFVTGTAGLELWIGCDGGVFRSRRGNEDNRVVKNSFVERNEGLTTLECGYVATHPAVEGHVLAGAQDNGTLERVGVNLWSRPFLDGDGGSVVFDPSAPHRFVGQVFNATWRSYEVATDVPFTQPILRSAPNTAAETLEDGNTAFYSGMDAVLVPAVGATPASSRLALGSTRVWTSNNWGAAWQTLTSLTDPMTLGPPVAQNNLTDVCVLTALGADDVARGQVIACRWASPTRLYALCLREVLVYNLVPNAAVAGGFTANRQTLSQMTPRPKDAALAAASILSPGPNLPAIGAWSDIAAHDNARGTHGSFYVAVTSDPTVANMDTVWWFDGTDRWLATGLKTNSVAADRVTAPAYAVVVDKRDRNTLYVGTAVGVWRGLLDPVALSWTWTAMNNGLPEAAVQDLSLHDEVPTGQRVLRAAIQARGIWEVDLATPAVTPRTLLRVHAHDTRRRTPTLLTDPKQPAPAQLPWHASPDLRLMPARGSTPPAPLNLPWNGATTDPYGLWVFQTALHVRGAGDPLVKPDGRWTPLFQRRLRDAVNSLPGSHSQPQRINLTRWNAIVGSGAVFPDAYADPWNSASPSEADLFELIADRAATAGSTASIGIGRFNTRVHVQVHHRHTTPAAAATVRVTLLMRDVSGTVDVNWATLPAAWTGPVQTLLRDGGANPVLADGWSFADAGTAVRSPAADVDVRLSRVVSFNVNLALPAAVTTVLMVAVVHSTADPVTLAGATLRDVVLGCRWVAARSVSLL